ncbi:MAG: hypothetical protein MJK15_04035 [Colwellia sp.]|nr:hypothetical protein [Colwellia sp.]
MSFNRVNPPEHIEPPIIEDRGLLKFLVDLKYIVFQLWKRTGAGSDWISENQTNIPEAVTISKLFDIRQQIGSNKPVTIDTDGFTIDTDEQTIDMTEV